MKIEMLCKNYGSKIASDETVLYYAIFIPLPGQGFYGQFTLESLEPHSHMTGAKIDVEIKTSSGIDIIKP